MLDALKRESPEAAAFGGVPEVVPKDQGLVNDVVASFAG